MLLDQSILFLQVMEDLKTKITETVPGISDEQIQMVMGLVGDHQLSEVSTLV